MCSPEQRQRRLRLVLQQHGGTRMSVCAEYSILSGSALGKLTEPIIHRMNDHEANTILANPEARMEA